MRPWWLVEAAHVASWTVCEASVEVGGSRSPAEEMPKKKRAYLASKQYDLQQPN